MSYTFDETWTGGPVADVPVPLIDSEIGEDIAWVFDPDSDTGATDVTAWTVQFVVAAHPSANPISDLSVPSASIAKTSGGRFTFSHVQVDTENVEPREYYGELIRTDSGNRKVLRRVRWKLRASPSFSSPIPATVSQLSLAKGGSQADLSATGPGVVIQPSTGGALDVVASDSGDTSHFLRKDLTWASPGDSAAVLVLASILWGSPGTETADIIEISAVAKDLGGNSLASSVIDVEILVSDGATDNEPSATAILSAAGTPVGTILRGSGTATMAVRTDASGHFAIAVHETAAAHRYLWINAGGNARLWARSATGVQELIFT